MFLFLMVRPPPTTTLTAPLLPFTALFRSAAALPSRLADILVAADGIHSVIRKQLHPDEGDPVYSGVNMWRGATVGKPFLQGANMVRIGWLATGKLVVYPIRNDVDGKGNQLINWVVEIETPNYKQKDRKRVV